MITIQDIEAMQIGDKLSEGDFITVSRVADTKTGKPRYYVSAFREFPVLRASLGSLSPKAAMKDLGRVRSWLKGGR